jgi:hypothetical protein
MINLSYELITTVFKYLDSNQNYACYKSCKLLYQLRHLVPIQICEIRTFT